MAQSAICRVICPWTNVCVVRMYLITFSKNKWAYGALQLSWWWLSPCGIFKTLLSLENIMCRLHVTVTNNLTD